MTGCIATTHERDYRHRPKKNPGSFSATVVSFLWSEIREISSTFNVQRSRFKVQGSGFKVQGSRFKKYGNVLGSFKIRNVEH